MRKWGRDFQKGPDPRRNTIGRAGEPDPGEYPVKKRHDFDLVTQACVNESVKHPSSLPGVSLRPSVTSPPSPDVVDSSNDIVDLSLLNEAHSTALRLHSDYVSNRRRRRATKHRVSLVMKKTSNLGFGVSVCYRCTQCKFVSPISKLYATSTNNGCVTNQQAGIALSKVSIKASDASYLFATLNLNAPSTKTLERQFTSSCSISDAVLEESLAENRGKVTDYMRIVGRHDENDDCPAVSVSLDGQYNRPVYHSYDGKSTSCSEPVIENETDLNLLVSHAVISKHDGTYEKSKVKEKSNHELHIFFLIST